MNVGVKIGPQNWREVLETTHAQYCEVWFRLDWLDHFTEIFSYLEKHQVQFGLHFWGILPPGIEPNLAYEDENVAEDSQNLMLKNIEFTAEIGAKYLNIHPGSLKLKKLNLDHGYDMEVQEEKKVDIETARASVLLRIKELTKEAQKRNILFLTETMPRFEIARGNKDRIRPPQQSENLSPEIIAEVAKEGCFITNDITHTTASWLDNDREVLFEKLKTFTQQTAAQTKVLHINTVIPPFNGTDSHNGITEEDFALGGFPSRDQIQELLKIFLDREDVWVVPEPQIEAMSTNYFALQKLVSELE